MQGHVGKHGAGWAFVADVGQQPSQRCTSCQKPGARKPGWHQWIDVKHAPVDLCPRCGEPVDPPAPQRRQVWRSGFRVQKDAQAALRVYLAQVEGGADPFPEETTVRDYAARWLEQKAGQRRPHTVRRYRQVMADHVLPVIGSLRLDRVKPAHVQQVLDAVAAKGLKARSRVETRAILGSMMSSAVKGQLIAMNPVSAVEAPSSTRAELNVPTVAELVRLMAAADGTPWEIPLRLAATSGARRGEVLALRWSDVDLDRARIRIVRGLQRVDGRLVFMEPKTDRARREVALLPEMVERLRRWRVEQAEKRLRLGTAWVDEDLVCERGDGAPLDLDAFTHATKRLAIKAGLPAGTRLHDVRHGVATAMLAQGVHPAIASAVLGHANTSFTMDTYQHVLDGMTGVAATALDEAFRAAR